MNTTRQNRHLQICIEWEVTVWSSVFSEVNPRLQLRKPLNEVSFDNHQNASQPFWKMDDQWTSICGWLTVLKRNFSSLANNWKLPFKTWTPGEVTFDNVFQETYWMNFEHRFVAGWRSIWLAVDGPRPARLWFLPRGNRIKEVYLPPRV